ncbi:MAG: glycosyltransferase [Deltaproteobacteria bacterium]|nr:glycosyltransferase [Deltaproteobacteria bacterium]
MTEKPQQPDPTVAIFVATSGHSGVDRLIGHLVPAIARRGYPVDVLKIHGHGPHFDELPPGVRRIDLGTKHVYTSFGALADYLKRHRPTVMLTDKDRVNRTVILARAWSRSACRLVVSSGTTISIDLAHRGPFERLVQRTSMGHLYRLADGVIVPSKGVADDMAAYTGLARERIDVIPCPVVSEDLFSVRQSRPNHPWYQAGEPPVILGVGELGPRKDFTTLIRAFAKLRNKRPCRLVIIGQGKEHHRLLATARELGMAEDVDLPGFVPNPYPYMAHAGLLAMTSRWEGLGFVLIEALAVGIPVVSTLCPSGPSEILDHGRYGQLVPIGDVDALAQAMAVTLTNPLPPAILREAARPYEIERSTTAYLKAMGLDPREPPASSF